MPILNYMWHDSGEAFTADLDGMELITADHGPHGWDGMEGIRDTLNKTAEVLGWEIRHYGDPCI